MSKFSHLFYKLYEKTKQYTLNKKSSRTLKSLIFFLIMQIKSISVEAGGCLHNFDTKPVGIG